MRSVLRVHGVFGDRGREFDLGGTGSFCGGDGLLGFGIVQVVLLFCAGETITASGPTISTADWVVEVA